MISLPLFQIELPFPPTVNHMYRPAGRGRKVLTSEAKSFREIVGGLVLVHSRSNREMFPIVGEIELRIEVYFPDKRKRDLDNLLKSTLDALQAARVFVDDSQAKRITIERREDPVRLGGSLMVSIYRPSTNSTFGEFADLVVRTLYREGYRDDGIGPLCELKRVAGQIRQRERND